MGVPHRVCDINWDRSITQGQRLNVARIERYRLLISQAKELEADTLCVAHHKDVRCRLSVSLAAPLTRNS